MSEEEKRATATGIKRDREEKGKEELKRTNEEDPFLLCSWCGWCSFFFISWNLSKGKIEKIDTLPEGLEVICDDGTHRAIQWGDMRCWWDEQKNWLQSQLLSTRIRNITTPFVVMRSGRDGMRWKERNLFFLFPLFGWLSKKLKDGILIFHSVSHSLTTIYWWIFYPSILSHLKTWLISLSPSLKWSSASHEWESCGSPSLIYSHKSNSGNLKRVTFKCFMKIRVGEFGSAGGYMREREYEAKGNLKWERNPKILVLSGASQKI